MPLFSLNSIGRCSGLEHQGQLKGDGSATGKNGTGAREGSTVGKRYA